MAPWGSSQYGSPAPISVGVDQARLAAELTVVIHRGLLAGFGRATARQSPGALAPGLGISAAVNAPGRSPASPSQQPASCREPLRGRGRTSRKFRASSGRSPLPRSNATGEHANNEGCRGLWAPAARPWGFSCERVFQSSVGHLVAPEQCLNAVVDRAWNRISTVANPNGSKVAQSSVNEF